MNERDKGRDSIRADIRGDVSGQVGVGKNIRQTQSVGTPGAGLTSDELNEIRHMFVRLRTQVAAEAPPEKKDAALARIEELEEAVTDKKPDVTTIEYVRNWFGKNLPKLAGAVVSVVVHPFVGKAVEAAGEMAAEEFRSRLSSNQQGAPAQE